jgi:CPA2 family monovalent cation:H+ antiporter-2
MALECAHVDTITGAPPDNTGCGDCLAIGSRWVHLRRCTVCGHVGCCDNSPNRHATAHHHATGHPIIQSYEPREDWLWCYVDELFFEVEGLAPSPSHP